MTATLPLPPVGINHLYHHSKAGGVYKDHALVAWEEECLWRLKGKTCEAADRYGVVLRFFFANNRRRDLDGPIKSCLDVLTKAGIYQDDALVFALHAYKEIDRANPRLELIVAPDHWEWEEDA